MKISIAIPCYEMNRKGVHALNHSFKIIKEQTLKDFEIVISDHSNDNLIENLCKSWSNQLNILYYRNSIKIGNGYANMNNALQKCSGEIIKLLCQDDFLYDEHSLQKTYDTLMNSDKYWSAHMYVHTNDRVNYFRNHLPSLNPNIAIINTIGSPSCVTIKNKDLIFFDEELIFRVDCEWYKRLFDKFGQPIIGFYATHVNYLHENQISNTLVTEELEQKEIEYIKRKHNIL